MLSAAWHDSKAARCSARSSSRSKSRTRHPMKAQLQRFGRTVRRRSRRWSTPPSDGRRSRCCAHCAIPTASRMANGSGSAAAPCRPVAAGASHRTRQPAAAFPEKSPAEIERILVGVMGESRPCRRGVRPSRPLRVSTSSGPGRPTSCFDEQSVDRFIAMRDGGQADAVLRLASRQLGGAGAGSRRVRARRDCCSIGRPASAPSATPSSKSAPAAWARWFRRFSTLRSGSRARSEPAVHVGMLVDQHDGRGVDVTFFGRTCKANPLIAQLARHLECPIRGVRVVRQPDGHQFLGRIERADRAAARRQGGVDVAAHDAGDHLRRSKAGCANIRSNGSGCIAAGGDERSHLPVLMRVHIRFISRVVLASWALIV